MRGMLRRRWRMAMAIGLGASCCACTHTSPRPAPPTVAVIAVDYARLALALDHIQPGYVAAYRGPAAQRKAAVRYYPDARSIIRQAQSDIRWLERRPVPGGVPTARVQALEDQLASLTAAARLSLGWQPSFDDFVRAIYDMNPPRPSTAELESALRRLDHLLPETGVPGNLTRRLQIWQRDHRVAPDRLPAVLSAALAAARERVTGVWPGPGAGPLKLDLVRGRPWRSQLRVTAGSRYLDVDVDRPFSVRQILELAAWQELSPTVGKPPGAPEDAVRVPASPRGLIEVGLRATAYDVVFPQAVRVPLERRLFAIAGLDPGEAARDDRIATAVAGLAPAILVAARRDAEENPDDERTLGFLRHYALDTPARARRHLEEIRARRGAIVRASCGPDLVRRWLRAETAGPAAVDRDTGRWRAWRALATRPHTPLQLQIEASKSKPAPQ